MAHFAELNNNNIVLRVIVVNNSDILDENGVESEEIGKTFCESLFGGRWIQTSYNNNFRKQYAGIGFYYDEVADVFIAPQPYASWILDENYDWQAPVPRPEASESGFWVWDEDIINWEFIEFEGGD